MFKTKRQVMFLRGLKRWNPISDLIFLADLSLFTTTSVRSKLFPQIKEIKAIPGIFARLGELPRGRSSHLTQWYKHINFIGNIRVDGARTQPINHNIVLRIVTDFKNLYWILYNEIYIHRIWSKIQHTIVKFTGGEIEVLGKMIHKSRWYYSMCAV